MPMARISMIAGKPKAYIRAIADGVHGALVETFSVPEHDRFQVIQQLDPEALIYDPTYFGMQRTEDFVLIDITVADWRDTATKQALYKAIADRLGGSPGISPQDVMVVLSPNKREDWSFGDGLASYVEADATKA